MAITASLVLAVFVVACRSIAKAALIVAAGVLLVRRGALTPAVRKGMSQMAAGLLVPCLLLERMASTVTLEVLAHSWPILPVGFVYVAIGCALGSVVAKISGTPPALRRATVAATAFANSQALPIIIIEVIGPELFGPSSAALGITYIGLYLILYLVLQWTIGASLLDVPLLSVGGGERPSRASTSTSAGEGDGVSMLSATAGSTERRGTRSPDDAAAAAAEMRVAPSEVHAAMDDVPNAAGGCDVRVALSAVCSRVASPPIYGIAVGLVVGLTPPLRSLFVSATAADSDAATSLSGNSTACASESVSPQPPLAFVLQAARMLGTAAIPVNTMLLGASLANGPTWRAVGRPTVAGVVLCKLLVLPLSGLCLVSALGSVVHLPPMLMLVMCIEASMPTANNLMMMCELAGGSASKMMSTVIFAQYCAAPVLLTATLTAAMALVQHSTPLR